MMRKLLLAIPFFIAATLAAQPSNPDVRYVSVAPSGACSASPPIQIVISTGAVYTCNNGTWGQSGGSIPNVIDATVYGVKANGKIVQDATTVNGSPTVTCPANDCNFTSADVGKIVFATNMTTDVSAMQSVVTVARSTILTVNSAQSITVSVNSTATVTGNTTLVWGNLDSAPYNVTQTTANDPLYAAWTAAQQSCLPLQLPSGVMMVEKSEVVDYTTGTPCAGANQQISIRQGYSVKGYGPSHTIIVPTPNFDPTTCTGGSDQGGGGCLLSVPTISVSDLSVFGAGNSSLTGFAGKHAMFIVPFGVGTNAFYHNLWLWAWGAQTTGFNGLQSGSSSVTAAGTAYWIDNTIIEAFGATAYVQYIGSAFATISNSAIAACFHGCAYIAAGDLVSVNNEWGYQCNGCGNPAAVVFVTAADGPIRASFTNDQWPWQVDSTEPQISVDNGATVNLTNGIVKGVAGFGVSVASGGVLNVSGTSITASTAAQSLTNSGTVYDLGGNTISGMTLSGSGSISGPLYGLSKQSVISSATTIAPVTQAFHVSGTAAIATITVPSFCSVSGMCQLTIIPDGIFTTTTGGNIALASTAVVNKQLIMTYDPGTSKWVPSY